MRLDSKVDLKHLKVDGGMTNGDLAMQVLADVGGFGVVRPEMREYVISRPFFFLNNCNVSYVIGPLHWGRHSWQDQLLDFVDGISTSQSPCHR